MMRMRPEQGVYMEHARQWSITFRWMQLDDYDNWTATIDHVGFPHPTRPARFIVTGPVTRFALHDMLKVLDCNVELALINEVGLQSELGEVVEFKAPAKPRM